MLSKYSRLKHAITRTAQIIVVVVVIVIIAVGAYSAVLLTQSHTTTTTTSSSSSTTSSSTSVAPVALPFCPTTPATANPATPVHVAAAPAPAAALPAANPAAPVPAATTNASIPSTFTYYTAGAINYLDPQVSYYSYDYNIIQNVYEPLLWFNQTSGTQLIPWLASSYSSSNNGMTWTINLRQGITFQDGEQFNSTAVYFSLNRVLIDDSSQVNNHNSGPGWILEQALNETLSSVLSGPHCYSAEWVDAVLAQNFVQITGPYSVQLNLQRPDAAFAYWLGIASSSMVAPDWVMQHDIALWQSNSYTLPYSSPSGNATTMMNQYFYDFASTCDTGATPKGCGQTALDFPTSGGMAGTGPYILSSFSQSTNNIVLTANPNYWGGAYQFLGGAKETPHITTIDINYVPDPQTAFVDLENAAKSGQAAAADIASTTFYNVVNRGPWLANGTLESVVPGVSLYGPYTTYSTFFDPYEMNVTNPQTGNFYSFQPFADQRIRLAFADSVNMTEQNIDVNNRQGAVANGLIPPGLPPAGAYNASLTPNYSYNPDAAAQLLLQAMEQPITHFTFSNGSAAPPGVFSNSFGCSTLPSSGQCSNPTPQTIDLVYTAGDTLDGSIMTTIASTINNISNTYNMGLTVNVQPVPSGQMLTEAFGSQLYMYALGWIDDYPWVNDFLGPMYAPGQAYPGPDGWNITAMGNYWAQAQAASRSDNITGLLQVTQAMNELANQMVMYLWTTHTYGMVAMTSNVQGFQFNPALSTAAGANAGPELFVQLY